MWLWWMRDVDAFQRLDWCDSCEWWWWWWWWWFVILWWNLSYDESYLAMKVIKVKEVVYSDVLPVAMCFDLIILSSSFIFQQNRSLPTIWSLYYHLNFCSDYTIEYRWILDKICNCWCFCLEILQDSSWLGHHPWDQLCDLCETIIQVLFSADEFCELFEAIIWHYSPLSSAWPTDGGIIPPPHILCQNVH